MWSLLHLYEVVRTALKPACIQVPQAFGVPFLLNVQIRKDSRCPSVVVWAGPPSGSMNFWRRLAWGWGWSVEREVTAPAQPHYWLAGRLLQDAVSPWPASALCLLSLCPVSPFPHPDNSPRTPGCCVLVFIENLGKRGGNYPRQKTTPHPIQMFPFLDI